MFSIKRSSFSAGVTLSMLAASILITIFDEGIIICFSDPIASRLLDDTIILSMDMRGTENSSSDILSITVGTNFSSNGREQLITDSDDENSPS